MKKLTKSMSTFDTCSLNFDLPDEAVLYVLGAIENNNLLCVLGLGFVRLIL